MQSTFKVTRKDSITTKLERFVFDISSFAFLDAQTSQKSPVSIMSGYKVLVMLQGNAKIYLGKDVYHTQSGDCVIFAPGSLYHAEVAGKENCQFMSVNFSLADIKQIADFANLLGLKDIGIYPALVPRHTQRYLYIVMDSIVKEAEGSYYNGLLLLKRLVGLMAYHGKPIGSEQHKEKKTPSQEQLVLDCHQFIMNNPQLSVTVEMLCKEFSVSQSYLYKCFKNVLGVSSKKFITNAQLDLAAKALVQTDKSIAQIATEYGYSNSFSFSGLFKKNFGISPSEYRKQNR